MIRLLRAALRFASLPAVIVLLVLAINDHAWGSLAVIVGLFVSLAAYEFHDARAARTRPAQEAGDDDHPASGDQ
jgi:hypothetical protein